METTELTPNDLEIDTYYAHKHLYDTHYYYVVNKKDYHVNVIINTPRTKNHHSKWRLTDNINPDYIYDNIRNTPLGRLLNG